MEYFITKCRTVFVKKTEYENFFVLCSLKKQAELNLNFMKIHKAIQDNMASALHGNFTKREEVLKCDKGIEWFEFPENNLYLQKSNALKC